MDVCLGFNGILSTQVAAISCLKKFKVSKANGVYKRDYAFRMNVKNMLGGPTWNKQHARINDFLSEIISLFHINICINTNTI